jgi:hypothetical protein
MEKANEWVPLGDHNVPNMQLLHRHRAEEIRQARLAAGDEVDVD